PEITNTPFPVDGEIYLDYSQHAFLRAPDDYRIRIAQFQNEVGCSLSSQPIDLTVAQPLSATIGLVSISYPDIPTGEIQVTGFSGGIFPYDVRIELDSASSFALPDYMTDFEAAGLNQNQEIEMVYENVPPGRYEVQVMDSLGCLVNLIARVPLDKALFIPNVFTPNGDGSNDVFFIRNLPQEPSVNQLMVSNRWGKEVFASENYQNDWDGEGAADGIYFYRLQVAEKDALTGWVEIIRGPKP
ncbi:MAG: gliding motility-associated C-terminal domain-containing protein, partial [Cyclobacteriaceae bacterium]